MVGAYEIQTDPFVMRRVTPSGSRKLRIASVLSYVGIVLAALVGHVVEPVLGLLLAMLAVPGVFFTGLAFAMSRGLALRLVRAPSRVVVRRGVAEAGAAGTVIGIDRHEVPAHTVRDVIVRLRGGHPADAAGCFASYIVLDGAVVELDTSTTYHVVLEQAVALREALGRESRPPPATTSPIEQPPAGVIVVLLYALAIVGVVVGLVARLDELDSLAALARAVGAVVLFELLVRGVALIAVRRAARDWLTVYFPEASDGSAPAVWPFAAWSVMVWLLWLVGLAALSAALLLDVLA